MPYWSPDKIKTVPFKAIKEALAKDEFHRCEKLTVEQLLECIKQKGAKVVRMSRSTNNYGEFLFIYITLGKWHLDVFGLGLHENRNQVYKHFEINACDNYSRVFADPKFDMTKEECIYEIECDYGYWKHQTPEPDDDDNKEFRMLAELTDDDAAYSDLCMD